MSPPIPSAARSLGARSVAISLPHQFRSVASKTPTPVATPPVKSVLKFWQREPWKPVSDTRHYTDANYFKNRRRRNGAGFVEIPFLSLLALLSLGFFWWVTKEHEFDNPEEISLSDFLERYLLNGRVEKLLVVNNERIKVILKEKVSDVTDSANQYASADRDAGAPRARLFLLPWGGAFLSTSDPCADISRPSRTEGKRGRFFARRGQPVAHLNEQKSSSAMVCSSNRQLQRALYQRLLKATRSEYLAKPDPDKVVSFRVGDITRLESILQSAIQGDFRYIEQNVGLPPIYYVNEFDWIVSMRSYIPILALTALSFVSLNGAPGGGLSTFSRAVPPDILQKNLPQDFSSGVGGGGGAGMNSGFQEKLFKFTSAIVKTQLDVPKTSFADVAGLEEAKLEVMEFVEFLRDPRRFQDLGAEIPKGALLVGPPGTGKTLLARAVAGEAGVPFFSMSGSDFMELFVGVGPSRIRDLFERARRNAPAIIFIDEIDAIGRSRASQAMGSTGGSDERESTLNALLVELDGFSSKQGVVVLAGTNRGDVLDSALTRPGRFDRRIQLSKPSVQDRTEIFQIHLGPIRLPAETDRTQIAKRLAALTPGLTGAEIKSVCNEGAILAARRNADAVTLTDFEAAVERLVGGLKHTGGVLTDAMKQQVALHEAGHAIVGWHTRGADPVLKLSIVPRANGSLGYTQVLPQDLMLARKEAVYAKIAVLLGGRAAEQLFAESISTGAADDLERATNIARACVLELGFDPKVGLRAYPMNGVARQQAIPLQQPYSEKLAHIVDDQIDTILRAQWDYAVNILKRHEHEVMAVAELLCAKEVVSFADLKNLLGNPPHEYSLGVKEYVDALPQSNGSDIQPVAPSSVPEADLCINSQAANSQAANSRAAKKNQPQETEKNSPEKEGLTSDKARDLTTTVPEHSKPLPA